MGNKGLKLLLLAALCLPMASWADYHRWQAAYSDFEACSKAMRRDIGENRHNLLVYTGYWAQKISRSKQRVFINAVKRQTDEPIKAVCEMRGHHRVTAVTTSPGHFVEAQGRITVEVASIEQPLRPAE